MDIQVLLPEAAILQVSVPLHLLRVIAEVEEVLEVAELLGAGDFLESSRDFIP